MSLTVNTRELAGPSPQQVAHVPGFQFVTEVSALIGQYRAMPLLANGNMLNANGLATSAPKFWGNACDEVLLGPPTRCSLAGPPRDLTTRSEQPCGKGVKLWELEGPSPA
jgi:hypothetical protein